MRLSSCLPTVETVLRTSRKHVLIIITTRQQRDLMRIKMRMEVVIEEDENGQNWMEKKRASALPCQTSLWTLSPPRFYSSQVTSSSSETSKYFNKLATAANVLPKVCFIGGGNMAQAIFKGLISTGMLETGEVGVSDVHQPTLQALERLGVKTFDNNDAMLDAFGTGLVFLAVKPQVLPAILGNHAAALGQSKLIVSIMAGIQIETIANALKTDNISITRVMPNAPAFVGQAASVLTACPNTSQAQVRPVDAEIFTLIDAMADGGVRMGLPRELAMDLAAQTVLGSAKMVIDTKSHPGQLKNMVCSPGGTSIAGVAALEQEGGRNAMIKAVEAAVKRAKELN